MSKSKPFIVGITGYKKSGKTTLIELLTKELTARGLVIGTIKNTTHEAVFDTPGKDTYRHRQAGAAITLIRSAKEVAIFTEPAYADQNSLLSVFERCDLILVEGDSKSAYPKIYVSSDKPSRTDIAGQVIATWGGQEKPAGIRNFAIDQITELSQFIIGLAKMD